MHTSTLLSASFIVGSAFASTNVTTDCKCVSSVYSSPVFMYTNGNTGSWRLLLAIRRRILRAERNSLRSPHPRCTPSICMLHGPSELQQRILRDRSLKLVLVLLPRCRPHLYRLALVGEQHLPPYLSQWNICDRRPGCWE